MSQNTPQAGSGGWRSGSTGQQGLITTSTPTAGPKIPYAQYDKDKKIIGGAFMAAPEIRMATQQQLFQDYGNLSDATRLDLAQRLKRAGYNVPVTGKYNKNVRDAFLKASEDFSSEIQNISANDPARLQTQKYDLTSFLDEQANKGAGASGGPSVVRRKTEYRPETIDAIVSSAFQDLVGRGPNQQELAKYRAMATGELSKTSNMGQTTYTNLPGGQVQEQVTREAFDPKQFLYSQVAGTDEAKANRVFSFYNAFKKALGV